MKWLLILKLVVYSSRIQIIPIVNQFPNITKINAWVQSQNDSTALWCSVVLQGPSGLKLCFGVSATASYLGWHFLGPPFCLIIYIINEDIEHHWSQFWCLKLIACHQPPNGCWPLCPWWSSQICGPSSSLFSPRLLSFLLRRLRRCQKHYESWAIWHAPLSLCPQSQTFHCRRQSGWPTMICLG